MVSMPNSRYDSFTFISPDTFVIPCGRTETINVFQFRPTPPPNHPDRGPAIHHLCALKLPALNPTSGWVCSGLFLQIYHPDTIHSVRVDINTWPSHVSHNLLLLRLCTTNLRMSCLDRRNYSPPTSLMESYNSLSASVKDLEPLNYW